MFNTIALRMLREEEKKNTERRIRRHLRDASNPLELPTLLFKQHYRVSKPIFKYLLQLLEGLLPARKKRFAIPPIVKLAASLRFLAEGSYQKGVGRDKEISLAQSSFSTVLWEVLEILEGNICEKWIVSPSTTEAVKIKEAFYKIYKIPGVVGAVDGTHVNIIGPNTNRHLYFNRKGNYSLNVMLVCDNELRIRYVDATHPGACHDSSVWNTSLCRDYMKDDYSKGCRNTWLLGDAGYPLEPWILTPYRSPQPASKEMKFNNIHAQCRNVIERSNGVLKNRWRCLLAARELFYSPEKVAKIVNVCVALHNICITYKSEFEGFTLPDDTTNGSDEFDSVTDSLTTVNCDTFTADAQRYRQNVTDCL